ncbi:MAG TPA: SDR family NAD(P)-dependent oxidoreductase, partial [Tepidisphaeraceae bacterium]|nr:SDR family NAD(P)-dependent oxidoreductase [Tepidisphaeraceae bacterium]
MHDRAALITGAGRGIGLAMAQALAGQGCAVAIQDIEQDVAAAEASKIEQAGGKAIALGGDIRDLSLPATLIAQTRQRLGGLHVLINNAAIQLNKPWLEQTRE